MQKGKNFSLFFNFLVVTFFTFQITFAGAYFDTIVNFLTNGKLPTVKEIFYPTPTERLQVKENATETSGETNSENPKKSNSQNISPNTETNPTNPSASLGISAYASTPTAEITPSLGQYLNNLFYPQTAGNSSNPYLPGISPASSQQNSSASPNSAPSNNSQPSFQPQQAKPQPQSPFQKLMENLGITQPQTPPTQNGPGGNLGDCEGLQKGPIAYNIGGNNGNGTSCQAKTIVVGYKQQFKNGTFNGGYINPMTESGQNIQGSSLKNCKQQDVGAQYGEKCFSDYSSGAGLAYIQDQLLHFQKEGERTGQKCVPLDIDNCDSIGGENYKKILDQIQTLNNRGNVKLRVFSKNPQENGCNFLNHPVVIGALVENASPELAKKIAGMRANLNQILVFTRGGDGSNQRLKQVENLKIPNSTFSYDTGGEYVKVNECSYNQ